MAKNYLLFVLVAFTLVLNSACNDDEPGIPNEEELITTLNYTLTSTAGGAAITMTFRDLDGDGANAPIITGGTLEANQTYTGSLELLNEAESPVEDITIEVREEDEEHQFFFRSDIADLTIAYNDQDSNGNPVGLSSTLTTGAAGSGNITITLIHEPNKAAANVSDGDITNAGGETDIAVTFPVEIQ